MDYSRAKVLGYLALILIAASFVASWPIMGLAKAGTVAGIISALAVVGAPVLRYTVFNLPPSTPEQLALAFDALREEAEAVWTREAQQRGLLDPPPARVIWGSSQSSMVATIAAKFSHVMLRSSAPRTVEEYEDWITAQYKAIVEPKIVITSEAGGGKSALAVLLTLGMLRKLRNGESSGRIPILASVASWDLRRDSLDQWLTRWIKNTYRSLNSPLYGGTAVDGLIATRKILPILDGLDELQAEVWPQLLDRLAKLPPDEPIIMTSRTSPYNRLAAMAGKDLNFYVIGLAPVEPDNGAVWLRKMCHNNKSQLMAWNPVITALESGRDPELTKALELPLYLQLSQVVFGSGSGEIEPTTLLDRSLLPGFTEIRTYLLRNYVKEAFRKKVERPLRHPAGSPKVRPHDWPYRKAERWLAFTASKLADFRTPNMAWWHMHGAMPPEVLGSAVGLITGIVYALSRSLPEGLTKGFAVGVGVAIFVGLSRGLPSVRRTPARAALPAFAWSIILVTATGYGILGNFAQASTDGIEVSVAVSAVVACARGLAKTWYRVVGVSILIGVLDGGSVGLWSTVFESSAHAITAAKDVAFSIAFGIVISTLFTTFLVNKATPAQPQRRDFGFGQKQPPSVQLTRGIAAGSAIGLAGGIVGTFHYDWRYGLALGLTFGVVAGVPVGLTGGMIRWFNEPTSSLPAATPQATLQDDRVVALVCMFSLTLVSTISIGVIGFHFFSLTASDVLPDGNNWIDGLRFGLCIGVGLATCLTTWPSFLLANVWFAVTGRLPWRFTRFLADAYTLGVLRQEGALYQMRHAVVGQMLTELYSGSKRSVPGAVVRRRFYRRL